MTVCSFLGQIYSYSRNGCLDHVEALLLFSFICKICRNIFIHILPNTMNLLVGKCTELESLAMEAAEEEEKMVILPSLETS